MKINDREKHETDTDPSRFKELRNQTRQETAYRRSLGDFFDTSVGTTVEKLENFTKYVPRQMLTQFLLKYEIFKRILHVHGSIVECGVLFGGGLLSWARLSTILEPLNHQRRVVGFDTFSGFVGVSPEDQPGTSSFMRTGEYAVDSYEDLLQAIALYDSNRFLNHIPKIELVRGDINETAPAYVKKNPHTVVSLLSLDVDLYEPTKIAIETFLPRMPKGSVIVFDQLNSAAWPGETGAVLKTLGIQNLRIERLPFESARCFAVLD